MAVKYIDFTNDQMRQMLALQPKNMAMQQVQAQAQPTTTVQAQPKGTLESILGGIGDSIANVGRSTVGLIGSGIAGIADLATGKVAKSISTDELRDYYKQTGNKKFLDLINNAANDGRVHYTGDLNFDTKTGELKNFKLTNEGENQDAFKKWLYGEDKSGNNPNYARAAGEALDAAATVSNFIPGANGIVGNTIQGAVGAFGQNYADTGGDLESALKAAAAGGAAGLATGGLNKGLNKAIAKGGKLANFATSKPLASTIARGGLSGAVGGAVGGGTAAGLNGGDVLTGATQGAISGAQGGAIAAPVMYGANKLTSKIPGIGGAQAALGETEQDYQNAKANGQRYYGFGSDNKAETAPGSLKNTYVAGDIIETPGKVVNGVKNAATNAYIKKNAIESPYGVSTMLDALDEATSPTLRGGINKSKDNINAVRNGELDSTTIGKLPIDYMEGTDTNPNIKYDARIINEKIMAGGAKNLSVDELAYSTNNYTRSKILEFEKNGKGRLNIVKPMGDKAAVIALEKQPNGNTMVTSIRPNADSNYVRNLQKNKGAKVLYDTIDGAATASITDYDSAASRAIADSNPSIAQDNANVNSKVDPMVEAQKKILSVKSRKQKEAAAKDLLNQLGTAPKPAAKAYRMIDNAVKLSERGLTTPEQWEIAADSITGRNGKISKLHTIITSTAGDIDTWNGINGKSMDQTIDKLIGDNGLAGTDAEKAIRREIQGALGMLPSRQNGSLTGMDDAADVMDVIRNLEAKERNYRGDDGGNQSTSDPLKRQKADTIGAVANILEDRIYDKVGDVSPLMTKEVISDLKNIFPGNKKWANYIDNDIAKIKTGKDLRAAQKPYVQTSNYLSAVKENFGTYGQRVGDVYGNAAAQALKKVPVVGSILAQAADSPIANRAYAKVHNIQSDMLDKQANRLSSQTPRTTTGQTQTPTTTSQVPSNLYNLIGQKQGSVAASDTLEAQLANMNTNEALQTTQNGLNGNYYAGGDVYGNATTPSYSTGTGAYNQGNDYLSRIEIGIQNAFNAGDFDSVEYLIDMYNTVSKMYQTEEPKQTKLTATQQRANAAATSLQRLANMTPDTGYAVSGIPVIGDLATLGGNSYLSEAQSLAQQIGYMVSGANIKKEEAESIGKAYVPQPFDSEQIRNEKLQRAAEIIRMYQNGYAEE